MAEATDNLAMTAGVELLSRLDSVEPDSIDVVFCLEVFEHLPTKETADALESIARVLSDDGLLVIGVPVEIGFPALYKGAFRMARRYGAFDATLGNVFACAIGKPPVKRPTGEIGEGRRYHAYHPGFDYRRFQPILSASFNVEAVRATPIPLLGRHINPEIYFLCRVRTSAWQNPS
jgi:SAM-dependent methyltransferase